MDRKYLLLFTICIAFICSCKKNNTNPQVSLVGKWNLQQQHAVLYMDDVKTTDTVIARSDKVYGSAQFNNDGTFSSSSVYATDNNLSSGSIPPSAANTNGTYSYSGNTFSITPGLAGWFNFATGTSGAPTGITQSVQLTQLSASSLTIHTENTFTVTNGTGAHSYKQLLDFYYGK